MHPGIPVSHGEYADPWFYAQDEMTGSYVIAFLSSLVIVTAMYDDSVDFQCKLDFFSSLVALTRRFSKCVQDAGSAEIAHQVIFPEVCRL